MQNMTWRRVLDGCLVEALCARDARLVWPEAQIVPPGMRRPGWVRDTSLNVMVPVWKDSWIVRFIGGRAGDGAGAGAGGPRFAYTAVPESVFFAGYEPVDFDVDLDVGAGR